MDDPLRQAEARVQRYWNVDGLHEIAAALIFGLTALWLWATDLSELPRAWKGAFSLTFPILLIGGMGVEGRIVKAIRRRLTYPRAGFVEFRKPSRACRIVGAATAFVVAMGLAIAIARLRSIDRWAVAGLGLIVGVFLWQLAWRMQLLRFYILGGVFALAGVAIAWAGAPFSEGMAYFWLIACAALLVSGGATLWRFLHATPSAEE